MDQNADLLNYIYQNSQMGISTTKQLENVTGDSDFSTQLHSQRREYTKVNRKAAKMLHQYGHTEQGLSRMTQTSSTMTIGAKTLLDRSPSHISDMMIQGSTRGIIDMTRQMKRHPYANFEILRLADHLVRLEQSNIEELKYYLS